MSRSEKIASSAKFVALTDTAVAFSAGLLIMPAIFSFNPDINTSELSESSVGLIFTFLPKIFLALQTTIGYVDFSLSTFIPVILFLIFANTVALKYFGVSFIG